MTTFIAPTTTPVAHPTADVLDSEFRSASRAFLRAKAERRVKDSPANRAAVEEALARADAVLDVYLDLRGV
jgi:hypothetical protein